MLVLASASPRRSELLRNAGISFTVDPAHVPEEPIARNRRSPTRNAWLATRRLPCWRVIPTTWSSAPIRWWLSTSTCWRSQSMRMTLPACCACCQDAHTRSSLACALSHSGFERTEAEVTEVSFAPLSDDEIAVYVRTGEPMDKAGAYAIQGIASRWAKRIDGCYFNVVGLPVQRVYRIVACRRTSHRANYSEATQLLLFFRRGRRCGWWSRAAEFLAGSLSFIDDLKLRMPSPSPLPSSPSFFGPKIRKQMNRMTNRCIGWNSPFPYRPPKEQPGATVDRQRVGTAKQILGSRERPVKTSSF